MSTKQKILKEALELFSKRGYSSVSVREISKAVGVRESALYKHFKNKQDVFDTLVEEYIKKSDKFMNNIGVKFTNDLKEIEDNALYYGKMNDEEFLEISISVFKDFLLKPEAMKFWKMVSIERYNNEKMNELFNSILFEYPMKFQEMFFEILIKKGFMKDYEPSILALEFYTPALMIYLRILPYEYNSIESLECIRLFEKHIKHFRKIYSLEV